MDYAFHHLGLDGDDGVDRPVVMTEALANPNASRASKALTNHHRVLALIFDIKFIDSTPPCPVMNELLFECYSVPRVAYGVDALFSLASNHGEEIVVSNLFSCFMYSTYLAPLPFVC